MDTISKQYQVSRTQQHDGKTRNTGKNRRYGHHGGGAPWES
ncbi:hypothetical protein [Streptomyces sp. SID10815]|nr:hypothetical protein [Streptomyces sp. SID10815]